VIGQSVDKVLGFIHLRDLMALDANSQRAPVRQLVRPVVALPDTVRVLHALTAMRRQAAHLAIVRDEYGGTAGIVTLEDLVEELIGDIRDEYDLETDLPPSPDDAIDGLMTLEQFADLTGYQLPAGPYDTLAGFWVAQHGAIPQTGESIRVTLPADQPEESLNLEMTVVEMDGRRAARITVRPLAK
jgi:putative hemolysin